MRAFILLIATVCTLNAGDNDSFLGKDKVAHFATSLWLTTSGTMLVERTNFTKVNPVILSGSATFSLGILKEVHDWKQPGNWFSYKDLVANLCGISVGLIILNNRTQ